VFSYCKLLRVVETDVSTSQLRHFSPEAGDSVYLLNICIDLGNYTNFNLKPVHIYAILFHSHIYFSSLLLHLHEFFFFFFLVSHSWHGYGIVVFGTSTDIASVCWNPLE
jgi:hypothetical protein